ncbi:MAG: flagellar hook-associated protein FlgL [Bacillota bacterium]
MRVTNGMINRTVTNNINRNKEMLSVIQEQMSSGRTITRASDNPVAAGRILSMKSVMDEQDQHDRNMEDAISWLDASEGALGNVSAALERIRELTVYGNNASLNLSDKAAIAYEIQQRFDELVQTANTNFGGRYIFGGYLTDNPPFTLDGHYTGDQGKLNWEIAPQVIMQVNITGDETFNEVLNVTKEVYDALQNGGKLDQQLNNLDTAVNQILSARAVLGAKSNRLQSALQRSFGAKINLTRAMSDLEDIDLPKTVMQYKLQESVYQAALATGAKLIQPTLLDFLR